MISHILAYGGGVLLTIATAPQLIKNIMTSSSDGLSWGLIICNTGGLTCYLVYAIEGSLVEMTISLSASLVLMVSLGLLKCYHEWTKPAPLPQGSTPPLSDHMREYP